MDEFVAKQLELLAEEHDAEIQENKTENTGIPFAALKRKGLCIPKLRISSLKTGLYGRTVTSFSSKTADKLLSSNTFSSGDVVQICKPTNQVLSASNGIVLSVSTKQVSIAFDGAEVREILDSLQTNDNSITLLKVANEITYRRLKQALNDLGKISRGPSQHFVEVLFGISGPISTAINEIQFCNPNLNHCQQEAVRLALSERELAIIHGPPGTGKTTTVVEIIAQLVKSGMKVLACAPSNVAVDNLVEKLSSIQISRTVDAGNKRKLKVVRIGHPARIHKRELHEMSLDALVSNSDAASIVRDVRSDIENLHGQLRKRPDKGTAYKLRKDRKELYAELAQREKRALQEILSSADVVLATNVGAHPKGPLQHLKVDHFDVVVIDECGQALEAACWIPLLNKRKCILSGDHLQLPPTIISHKAAAAGLSVTLLERLVKLHPKSVAMLVEQYRMNKVIMEWASKQMYDGKLTAHQSVELHLLSDLPNVLENEETNIPILLVDTSGCDMNESESESSDSKANEGEALIVYEHVTSLVEAGVSPGDIAVISPYNLQVEILRKLLQLKYPKMEIKSVDGFQGREKEAVVLSLVRSNDKREIGFLADNRRLNVAITRARRHLAVVCDTDTVNNHEFIKSLVDYITEHGEVRTGFEYGNDVDLDMDCFAELVTPKANSKSVKPKTKPRAGTKEKSSRETVKPASNKTLTPSLEDYKQRYQSTLQFYSTEHWDSRDFCDSLAALNIKRQHMNLVFDTKLNSAERKAVHELCEEIGLNHTSIGEGPERQVIVSRVKMTEPNDHASTKDSTEDSPSVPSESDVMHKEEASTCSSIEKTLIDDIKPDVVINFEDTGKVKPASSKDANVTTSLNSAELAPKSSNSAGDAIPYESCEICGKNLPQTNMDLHLMHCARILRMKASMEASKKTDNKIQSAPKKKGGAGKNKKQKQKEPQKDDDFEILNDAIASNRICCHGNCSSYVTTTGQQCAVCKRMFCLKHSLPEVHGCGSGARTQARRQISRDGVLYQGGGVPDRKLPADKRAALKNKLSNKVKTMEDSRRSAQKNKSK
uniref:DNA helicase n=1 Tax=Phallusia mammillata TaxID=59560 RepID=A0A6F9DEI3_9ASCI|nr:ZF(AN1/A20like)-2 zinc finger protein 2 [Phallusia mammillata]